MAFIPPPAIGRDNNMKLSLDNAENLKLPSDKSLDIDTFSKLFSLMNQSYKLFWFRGILEGIRQGQNTQKFGDIVDRMAADGWPLVVRQKLSLGPVDALEKMILALQKESGLSADADREAVVSAIKNSKDPEVFQLKHRLIKYVPYRLQTPFMRGENWQYWDDYVLTTAKINSNSSMLYMIGNHRSLYTTIQIRPAWMKYLTSNMDSVVRWTDGKLLSFLKNHNQGLNQDITISDASAKTDNVVSPGVISAESSEKENVAVACPLAETKPIRESRGKKHLTPRQRLWRRIKREFPKKKLLGDITIDDDEFELLVQELNKQHRRLMAQPERFEADEVFCVALVQFGIRFYDDGAYWPFIEQRVNPGYFKNLHKTQFGNAYLEFMKKNGKLLNEEKKAMSNILLHGFVSDHKSGELFDFLYSYYSIDLARDINMLDRDAMNALVESIKANDGRKRTYNLVEHTSDAVRINERGCKTRLRRYLKMIDHAFWNPGEFTIRSENRLMKRFAEWWNADEEKIERDRVAGGRNVSRHQSGWKPYLKYGFENDRFTLVLPARLVRKEDQPSAYWTVQHGEDERRVEVPVNEAVTGFIAEETAIPLDKPDVFGLFETQFFCNEERLSRWKIPEDPIRFFDIDGYSMEPSSLRAGNAVSFSAEDYVPISDALYLKEQWDGLLRCSYQFEEGDLIVFPDRKVLSIGKKPVEGLLKRGLQSGVFGMRENKRYPIYAAAPSLFARILPKSMNGAQLRVNGAYYRLFDENIPQPGVLLFDLQERVPEEGMHIALNQFGVVKNGIYHIELDVPNDHADRTWDFLLIDGLEYSFDESPYIFVETGVLCVPEKTGLMKHDSTIKEEHDEGQLRFAFEIPEEDEYFRLCMGDTIVAFEIPRLSYRFQGEGKWRSSLLTSIWHKDLPDFVEVRYPADRLTILLDEEGNDDEDSEQHVQSYMRNQEKGYFVCNLHPFRSWFGKRVAVRRLYVRLPGMDENVRFMNINTKNVFVSAVLSADLREDVIHGEFDIIGKASCYADLWFGDKLLLKKEPIVDGKITAKTEVFSGIYKVDIYESDTDEDGFDEPDYDYLASKTMELINPANLTGSHIEVKQLVISGTDSYLRLKRSYTLYDLQPEKELGKGYYSGHMVVRDREYGTYRHDYQACVHIPDPEELTKAYFFTLDEYGEEQAFIYDNDRRFLRHYEDNSVSGVFKYRRFIYLWEDMYVYRIEFVDKPDGLDEKIAGEKEELNTRKQKQAAEERYKDSMRKNDPLSMPLIKLGLSVRNYNTLRREGIGTSTDLYTRASLPGGLFRIHHMRAKDVEECIYCLRKAGYSI